MPYRESPEGMPSVEEIRARERVEKCPKPHWEFRDLNFLELLWHNHIRPYPERKWYNFRCLNCGQILTW